MAQRQHPDVFSAGAIALHSLNAKQRCLHNSRMDWNTSYCSIRMWGQIAIDMCPLAGVDVLAACGRRGGAIPEQ